MLKLSSPELLRKELRCEGKRVKLYNLKLRYHGRTFERDLVSFGRSVAIAPVNKRGELYLLRQWRSAVMNWILEVPAGRVEEGESPERAAIRELKEETGLVAGKIEKLTSFRISPGYSDEHMYIYLATDLKEGAPSPEVGEVIEVLKIPLRNGIEKVLRGEITDMKTAISILLVAQKFDIIKVQL